MLKTLVLLTRPPRRRDAPILSKATATRKPTEVHTKTRSPYQLRADTYFASRGRFTVEDLSKREHLGEGAPRRAQGGEGEKG
jgi:hypothetical protein